MKMFYVTVNKKWKNIYTYIIKIKIVCRLSSYFKASEDGNKAQSIEYLPNVQLVLCSVPSTRWRHGDTHLSSKHLGGRSSSSLLATYWYTKGLVSKTVSKMAQLVACQVVWRPELDPQNLHSRRELTLIRFSFDLHRCTVTCVCPYMYKHEHTHRYPNVEEKKIQ